MNEFFFCLLKDYKNIINYILRIFNSLSVSLLKSKKWLLFLLIPVVFVFALAIGLVPLYLSSLFIGTGKKNLNLIL